MRRVHNDDGTHNILFGVQIISNRKKVEKGEIPYFAIKCQHLLSSRKNYPRRFTGDDAYNTTNERTTVNETPKRVTNQNNVHGHVYEEFRGPPLSRYVRPTAVI